MDTNFLNQESGLYKVMEWISKLVFLNLIWIFFSLIGFIIIGVMPATVSMFFILKMWLSGQDNIPLFKTYWAIYKKNFIKANLLGCIMGLISFILLIDLRYFLAREGLVYFLSYLLYLFMLLYFFTLLYLFPVYVTKELKLYQIIKDALFFSFITPYETILMLLGIAPLLIIYYFLPGLIPFTGASSISYLLSRIYTRSLNKLEIKVKKINSNNN